MIEHYVYSSRSFVVLSRKELGLEILHPEQVLLSLTESERVKPIDIGSLCFSIRAPRRSGWNTNREIRALPVVLDSLIEHRRKYIARLLDTVAVSGLRDESINTGLRGILQAFEWVDANHHSDFLATEEAAEKAYIAYTDYLYHQIQNGKMGVTTAAKSQRSLIQRIIGLMFPNAEYQIKAKTYHIREQKLSVQAPSHDNVYEYLSYLIPFVRGLRKALMNDNFPLRIKDGKCNINIFTTNTPSCYSPTIHYGEYSLRGIFNLASGEVLSIEEYVEYKLAESNVSSPANFVRCALRSEYRRSLRTFEEANADRKRSFYRTFWAQKVIRGYAQLLQFLTGMNVTPLIKLRYEDALAAGKGDVKKDLIAIKHRARGRAELYPIGGRRGLKLLKEYLEFRDWLLDGDQYELLFFTNHSAAGRRVSPVPLDSGFQHRLFKQLKGKVFPEYINNIPPSSARKYKSIALEHIGATEEEVADLLNHSLETNRRHYGAPSIDDSKRELSQFWGAVKQSVEKIRLIASDTGVSDQEITVGHCDDLGNPQAMNDDPPIEPNCRTQYGCLYCEHYACHADAEDVRKLLCLKYVIKALREQADDFEAADDLFQGLCLRVEGLLRRMVEVYPEMTNTITKIHEEVFELGILTPFWESRLRRYEEMGILL